MMEGFATFKTSSMTRQEATSDHTSSIKVPEPRVDFQAALKKAKTEDDLAAIVSVYWLASQVISLCFKKFPSYTLISSHMNY